MVDILTDKEKKIIEKKLSNKKLNQIDRNRLSRTIRPKLRAISLIDSKGILNKLEYRPEIISIENKIIKIIIENIEQVDSIILYGSAIQTNYREYNDLDIMVVTKSKIYKREIDKYKKIKEIKDILKNRSIISDIEIVSKDNLIKSYKNSPTLIYQLKDSKVIYGNIQIPSEIEIYKMDLRMKLDWSDISLSNPTGNEIYGALRNVLLVRLLLNKIVDNNKLKEYLNDEIGKNLIQRLRTNQASKLDKKIALCYLKFLLEKTEKEVGNEKWEKIELSSHSEKL